MPAEPSGFGGGVSIVVIVLPPTAGVASGFATSVVGADPEVDEDDDDDDDPQAVRESATATHSEAATTAPLIVELPRRSIP